MVKADIFIFNDYHSSVQADNQIFPLFDFTIKTKHNLAEIDLLKILHDLKYPISVYDTIVGWATRWNFNKDIFDSNLSYNFKNEINFSMI